MNKSPLDPETWLEAHEYTPDRLAAARRVLGEILQGKEVWQAMRHYPLPE